MADVITRLKIESGEYDSKIRRAVTALQQMEAGCRKVGGSLAVLERDQKDYVQSLGRMETVSTSVRGKIGELTNAYTELAAQYRRLTDEEKKGDFGRALSSSLSQLKQRITDSKAELNDISRELGGTQSKGIDLSGAMQTLGSKFGISSEALSMLSSGTIAYTAVLGGLTTAVVAGTNAWIDYNAELAKQDQITTVTTGLKGEDANRMTNQIRALSDTYGVDFREAVNAANTLMAQFGKTGDEAIRLLRDGMQGMIQGDGPKLLSMIQQYAPSFRDAGIEASQLVAIIQNSEGGIFTDQNMNAIVMGIKNIRLMTKPTSDALAQLGIDGQKMSQQLSDGSLTIFDALKQVATAIQGVGSGSQAAGEVMQQVFGRQGAMAGTKLGEAIATLNINLDETKRQTGEIGQAYDDLYGANVRLNTAIRDCFEYDGWDEMATGIKANLVGALASVLEITAKIKDSWVGELGSTIFDTMGEKAVRTYGPLGKVYQYLKDIGGLLGGGTNTTRQAYSDVDALQQYINNGKTTGQRQQRYNRAVITLQRQLAAVGQEQAIKNPDGSTSYKVRSEEEQENMRNALRRRISMLKVTPVEPKTPEPPRKPIKPLATPTNTKNETPALEGSIDAQTQKVQELQRAWRAAADDDSRQKIKTQLDEAQRTLDTMTGKVQLPDPVIPGSLKAYQDQLKESQADVVKMREEILRMKEAGEDPADILVKQDELDDAIENLNVIQKKIDELNGKTAKANIDLNINTGDFNGQTYIQKLQEQLLSDAQNANMSTLGDFMNRKLREGMEGADLEGLSALLRSKIFPQDADDLDEDIDTYIETLKEKLGDKIKNSEWDAIKLAIKTGDFTGMSEENKNAKEDSNDFENFTKGLNTLTAGLSSISSGLKNIGVEVPKDVDKVIGVINGVSQVITGVQTVISLFGAGAMASNTAAVLLNTGAIGGLIAALNTNTFTNLIPGLASGGIVPAFAQGGTIPKFADGGLIGRAAAGMMIPGNSMSGDRLRLPVDGGRGVIGVNSGELILNKSSQNSLAASLMYAEALIGSVKDYSASLGNTQQTILADQLEGSPMGGLQLDAVIGAEDIQLVINNRGRRTGRGEYVQSRNRRQ